MEDKINQTQPEENTTQPKNPEKTPAQQPKKSNKAAIIVIVSVALLFVVAAAIIIPKLVRNSKAAEDIILDNYYYCESADTTVGLFNDNSFVAYVYSADSYKIIEGTYEINNKNITFTPDSKYGGKEKTYSFENGEGSIKIDGKTLTVEQILKGTYFCAVPGEGTLMYNFMTKHIEVSLGSKKFEGVFHIKGDSIVIYIDTDPVPENLFIQKGRQECEFKLGDGFVEINGITLVK